MSQFYSGTRTGNLDSSSQLRQTASRAIEVYSQVTHLMTMILSFSSVVDIPLEGPRPWPKADPIIHTHTIQKASVPRAINNASHFYKI